MSEHPYVGVNIFFHFDIGIDGETEYTQYHHFDPGVHFSDYKGFSVFLKGIKNAIGFDKSYEHTVV